MAFPKDHAAGAMKLVGDKKLAAPVEKALNKCRDEAFPVMKDGSIFVPKLGTESYIKAVRVYAAQEFAKALESQAAQNLRLTMMTQSKKIALKLGGQGFKNMLAEITNIITVKGLNPEFTEKMYELDMLNIKLRFILWIKTTYVLKQNLNFLFQLAFPTPKGQ